MNKIALISASFSVIVLIASCAVDPVYIERRLPLPTEPQYPPIHMKIGEQLTTNVARDITIRDFLLHDYIAKLKMIIKSTHDEKE